MYRFKTGSKFNLIVSPNDVTLKSDEFSEGCTISGLMFTRFIKFLLKSGHIMDKNDPDFHIISSCCLTMGTRNVVATALREQARASKAPIVLFGCFAGVELPEGHEIIKMSSRTIEDANDIFEHHHDLPIENILVGSSDQDLFRRSMNKMNTSYVVSSDEKIPQRDVLKPRDPEKIVISHGCNYRCTFCNIKAAKGNPKSEPISKIIQDIKKLLNLNTPEATLTESVYLELWSEDPGSYGTDIGTNIIELLDAIVAIDPNIVLSIPALYPKTFFNHTQDIIRLVKTKRIVRMDVPLQSASKKVLKRMGRGQYDINEFIKILEKIKSINPNIFVSTQIIINFPGETIDDLTKSLTVSNMFDDCDYINYSDHPDVPSYKFKDKLSKETCHKRLKLVKRFIKATGKGTLYNDLESAEEAIDGAQSAWWMGTGWKVMIGDEG